MAGNVYKQYVWLLDVINRSDGILLKEISDKWQRCSLNETGMRLPRRTFHNHLQKIYEIFGVEIGYTKGYGYHIIDPGDIDLCDTQQSMLAHLQLSNALFSNPEMARRISLDGYMSYRYFAPLIEAMETNNVVELHCPDHKRLTNDWHTSICIEPYYIKQFEQEWFVVGRDVEHKAICAYAFSAISAINKRDESFEIAIDIATFMRAPQFGTTPYNSNDLYMNYLTKSIATPRRSRWTKLYIGEEDSSTTCVE